MSKISYATTFPETSLPLVLVGPVGRRRLAYEIGHKGEGSYHLLNFDAEAETLEELSRILRITDGVMRHLAVRRIEGGSPGPPPPEPEPERESVPEPAYAEANIGSQEEE